MATLQIERSMSELNTKQLYRECEECRHSDGSSMPCPSCDGRRFVPSGLTVGQVVAMVLQIEMLKPKARSSAGR
jgi:hypothetical protein